MRRAAALALALAIAVSTAACTAAPEPTTTTSPTEDAVSTRQSIQDAIGDMGSANSSVEASPVQDGLTAGWSVVIERSTDAALTADELRTILEAVWTNATADPAFIRITVLTDGGSRVVDLSGAASELGVEYVMMREVYVFQGATVEGLLGEWSAS